MGITSGFMKRWLSSVLALAMLVPFIPLTGMRAAEAAPTEFIFEVENASIGVTANPSSSIISDAQMSGGKAGSWMQRQRSIMDKLLILHFR